MLNFADNIRILRDRRKISQQKLADDLMITRSRYVKYEDSTSEPPLELLVKMSKYFGVSVDLLLNVDIRKYQPEDLLKISENRILLPVAVDSNGDNKIEIIPGKASMGYLNGYTDPEYIENLQTVSLPFLRNGKYRAFPADGDSMPPYKDGTYIVGKFVENIGDLKSDKTYVFITVNDGITYKRFQYHEGNFVWLKSDNSLYEPYKISLYDIKEIWEFACSINTQEYQPDEFGNQNIREMFSEIQSRLANIENKKSK